MSRDPSHVLRRRKRALRRAVLERRDHLSGDERAASSRRIVDRVVSLEDVRSATTVMTFWSFGSEVETGGLIERLHEAGKRVALPRIAEGELEVVGYRPGDPVAPTSFGAMEPERARVLSADEVDVVVVPGVAFDRRGRRLGYGGGFYDRLAPRLRDDVRTVGVAFSVQIVAEVPEGGHDRRVDVVVTEDEVIEPPG